MPLALNLERHTFGPCSLLHSFLAKRPSLLFSTHFLQKCGTFKRLSACESPEFYADSMQQAIVMLSIAHLKAICVQFSAHLVVLIFQYSAPKKNFCKLDIMLWCYATITRFTAIETLGKQWMAQQTKSP